MKRLLSIIACWLLVFSVSAQVQVYTARQVDSIATQLRKEIGNVPTPEPEPGQDCPYAVKLVSVYDVDQTALWYNFYSQGVRRMTEVVRNSLGREVLRHTTDPVTRDRIQLIHNLRAGSYTLTVENADCKAVSEPAPFTVPGGDPVDPDPGRPSVGFENKGVYSTEQNGYLYEWIPSENLTVEVKSDGRVKLSVPETKRSRNGNNECRPFLLGDMYDNRLLQHEEKALLGEGLMLPVGQYGFKVIYLNSASWPDNLWPYVGFQRDGSFTGGLENSAQSETVTISVTDKETEQYRAAWFPQYHQLNEGLRLPEGKIFAITRYMKTLPLDQIWNNATHVQNPGGVFNDYGPDRYWFNIQARPGTRMPDQVARETPMSKRFVAMAELTENYGNDLGCDNNSCYNLAQDALRQLFEKAKRELGVTSPAETWIIDDYFSALYGASFGVPHDAKLSDLSFGLRSVANAKRRYVGTGSWADCWYFTGGAYNYRNYIVNGYLGNILSQANQDMLYNRIYNLEKAGMALPDRRKISYITNAQEALHQDAVTDVGSYYLTPFENGTLSRVDGLIHSFETMRSEAFYSLLLANGVIIWESNIALSDDPGAFGQSWFGGFEDWKTRWKKNGDTGYNTYVSGQNGAPVMKPNTNGQFPEKPMVGDQGAYIGAKDYESIAGRSGQLWYPDFTYNGKLIRTKEGSRGKLVSANGVQNEGQDNIAVLKEEGLPIVLKGSGPEGDFVSIHAPRAGLTSVQTFEVEGRKFVVTGNRLNVFRL